MINLAVIFLTGLTTGGLSCLAVQGGLLASSVARQVEDDLATSRAGSVPAAAAQPVLDAEPNLSAEQRALIAADPVLNGTAQAARSLPADEWAKIVAARRKKLNLPPAVEPRTAVHTGRGAGKRLRVSVEPILFFLGAKLAAYTILGLLLGALGSVVQLSPVARAVLQIVIGIVMIGTALRMLDVHPIFRYFVIEPPRAVTRKIRSIAKQRTNDVVTPAFLGALTVLIPCGVTQAMMVLAVGTGDPLMGAAVMFAFTLGTSPLFFALAYMATRLGETMHTRFVTLAAVAVLVLGFFSIEGGWNLLGAPMPFENNGNAAVAPAAPAAAPVQTGASGSVITINALNTSYSPNVIQAKAGEPVKLQIVTNNTTGCTRAFVIPAMNIQKILPQSGTTVIELPPQQAGTLRYTCSMGMYGGRIDFVN